jgi:Flp pilus assembly protein TadG
MTTLRSQSDSNRVLRPFLRCQKGSVAIIFSLVAIPIFGASAVAIDYARALKVQSQMQAALDAAVLAGREAEANQREQVASAYFSANFTNANATATFVADGNGNLSGSATASVPTTIAAIIDVESLTVSATSTAIPNSTETVTIGMPCIHVMDQSGLATFWLESTSDFDARKCEAHVRSNHSGAMLAVSSSNVAFKKILVKGSSSVIAGNITIVDAPYTITNNADVTGDPYADAVQDVTQALTAGACSKSNTGKTYKNTTVQPGTFCGATTFEEVTFDPGLYIITSGTGNENGALTIKGKVTGDGVSFYLADNKSKISMFTPAQDSVLKAPTNGTTKGLLMFENSNRGNKWDLIANSISKQTWTGLIYLPSINLTLESLSDSPNLNISIAANSLKLKSVSKSTITPYEWTPFNLTSPIVQESTTLTTTGLLAR